MKISSPETCVYEVVNKRDWYGRSEKMFLTWLLMSVTGFKMLGMIKSLGVVINSLKENTASKSLNAPLLGSICGQSTLHPLLPLASVQGKITSCTTDLKTLGQILLSFMAAHLQ